MSPSFLVLISLHAQCFSLGLVGPESVAVISPATVTFYPVRAPYNTTACHRCVCTDPGLEHMQEDQSIPKIKYSMAINDLEHGKDSLQGALWVDVLPGTTDTLPLPPPSTPTLIPLTWERHIDGEFHFCFITFVADYQHHYFLQKRNSDPSSPFGSTV